MPINIHEDEIKAWKFIEMTINKVVRNNTPMDYDHLVFSTIKNHAVGERQVDKHIKRFYIKSGLVELKDDMLFPPFYQKVKQEQVNKERLGKEADEEIKRLGLEVQQ